MQRDSSFHRILFVTVFLLYPFLARTQVNIKERIEIKPKPAMRPSAAATEAPFFAENDACPSDSRDQSCAVQILRPCVINASGTVVVKAHPTRGLPNSSLMVLLGDYALASYYKYWNESDPHYANNPQVIHSGCGYTGPELYSYDALGLENVSRQVGPNSATFTFTGELNGYYQYTATASLSASADDSYNLSTIAVSCNRTTITKCDNTVSVSIQLRDAAGRAFPSGACGSQPDLMTVSFSSTTATPPSLVIDYADINSTGTTLAAGDKTAQLSWNPASAEEEGQVIIQVDASGKTGATTVTLSKEVPPPVLSLDYERNIMFGMKSTINAGARDCKGTDVSLSPTVTYQFSILSGPGLLLDPSTGRQARSLGFIAHKQGKASVTYSSRDSLFGPTTQIEARTTDDSIASVYADIQITPTDLVAAFDKNPVYFGDSATLTVQLKNADGTLSPIPSEWVTMYNIIDGDTLAFFSTPDGVTGGTYVWGNYPWIRVNTFPQVSPPDSLEVTIGITSFNSGGGGVPTSARLSELMSLKRGRKWSKVFPPRNDSAQNKAISIVRSESHSKVRPTIQEDGGGSSYHYGIATLVVRKKQNPLHHFAVQLTRDTIGYNDTSCFRVIAKDAEGNEVGLDTHMLMRFSVDSTQYGSYRVSSETIPTRELEVFYGDARNGNVRFVANKLNPITVGPKTLTFEVHNEGEYSKTGIARLTILEKAIMTVAFNKKELRPLGDSDNKKQDPTCKSAGDIDTCRRVIDFQKVDTTTLTLTVKDRFNGAVANYPFTMTAHVREFSGGHDHSEGRPTGRFVASRDTFTTFRGVTATDGKAKIKYLCSGFGGVDSIHLEGPNSIDTLSSTITVRVEGLKAMVDGEHYQLIGQYGQPSVYSEHLENHFARQSLLTTLMRLADSVYSQEAFKLRINDISLALGGPFDISNDWNTPHQHHRLGSNVDLDDEVLTSDESLDSITKDQLEQWVQIVASSEDFRLAREAGHFHLTFK